MIAQPHVFQESLQRSHDASDLPIWEEMYRQAFPGFVIMVDHRQDGEHQRAGVDRSITLENSKQILVDEKARGRNRKTGKVYEDIALEFFSDRDSKSPGWVSKPLRADYIAYAILPLGIGYLLPVPGLQRAWSKYGRQWWRNRNYPNIDAFNKDPNSGRTWVTSSVCVPPNVVYAAINDVLSVRFTAHEWPPVE